MRRRIFLFSTSLLSSLKDSVLVRLPPCKSPTRPPDNRPSELRTLWNGMAREQEEQDRAESERMKRLAAEVFEFNRLKQMTMSEKDRRERYGTDWTWIEGHSG